jgi:ArsR family transcriptional regulator
MSNYRNIKDDEAALIFKALANPNRVRIFIRLASGCRGSEPICEMGSSSCCVGELGKELNIAASTVSHHIKELKNAGLINLERRGRTIMCWVDPVKLKELSNFFNFDKV